MAILTVGKTKTLLAAVLERITGLEAGRVIWEADGGQAPPEGLYCSLWWKEFSPLPQNEGEWGSKRCRMKSAIRIKKARV